MYRALRPFSRNPWRVSSTFHRYHFSNDQNQSYFTEIPNRTKEEPTYTKFITMQQSSVVIKNRFLARAHVIPHPEKDGKCEDAYFICQQGNTFGLADGVGVWSELGINSASYSTALIQNIKEYVEEHTDCSLYDALVYAYTQNLKSKAEGSSTVCLARVVGRELFALNLGDSAFAIVRNNEMIYKSEEQSHSFNYPYQLGTGGDAPAKSHCIQCTMKKGDLIIMGTDGLFDNLYPDEITDIIKSSDEEKIALNLAVSAMAAACSTQKETPFSERVAEETDQIWRGGKMDDITVISYKVP